MYSGPRRATDIISVLVRYPAWVGHFQAMLQKDIGAGVLDHVSALGLCNFRSMSDAMALCG